MASGEAWGFEDEVRGSGLRVCECNLDVKSRSLSSERKGTISSKSVHVFDFRVSCEAFQRPPTPAS